MEDLPEVLLEFVETKNNEIFEQVLIEDGKNSRTGERDI